MQWFPSNKNAVIILFHKMSEILQNALENTYATIFF